LHDISLKLLIASCGRNHIIAVRPEFDTTGS